MKRAVLQAIWGGAAVIACSRPSPSTGSAGANDAGTIAGSNASSKDFTAMARAEDTRAGADIPETVLRDPDVATRSRAARAWARIGDSVSLLRLDHLLSDGDDEVATWAAYGLGFHCRAHKTEFTRTLAARFGTLDGKDTPGKTALREVLRSIGRCDGDGAEALLTQVLARTGAERATVRAAAALGLGEIATHRRTLGGAAIGVLLDAVEARPLVGEAMFALSRAEIPDAVRERTAAVMKKALQEPSAYRLFAIRVLARTGTDPTGDLRRIVADTESSIAERIDAARGLGASDRGRDAAAELLEALIPKGDPLQLLTLGGSTYGLVSTLLASLGSEPPRKAETVLRALSTLSMPEPPPSLARRLESLRCKAAVLLSHGAYDNEIVKKCAPEGTYARERARFDAAVEKQITGDRRAVWLSAWNSSDRRLREAALQVIGTHAELGETGRKVLALALGTASDPGVVATAAETIFAHPERCMVLSAKEKRAALDPKSPPPTVDPEREIDDEIARALKAALARTYARDRIETRVGLLDAAAALRLPAAKEAAERYCKDPNATVRDRAEKAFALLGIRGMTCAIPNAHEEPAPEIFKPPRPGGRAIVAFATEAGELRITLDPTLAPITVERLLTLTEAGFYNGIVVHRVVPGFVVQFGDPQGDGYGGSGSSLRCETSPRPFEPLSVGMALSGRDTGSSQIFVTLSRTPHLDGAYALIGKAEGDWNAVAEGDVIQDARVINP